MHARLHVLLSVLVLLSACADGPSTGDAPRDAATSSFTPASPGWEVGVAADLGEKLGGCTLGDVDPRHPGQEIVVVAESGAVTVVHHGDQGWSHEQVASLPGEMIQVASGVLDPNLGHEVIVAVGMAVGGEEDGGEGAAHLVVFEDGAWTVREIHRSPALLHAVCVGDIDPDHPGAEVLVAGFARKAMLLWHVPDGWRSQELAELPGPAKSAVVYGLGAALPCADGSLVHVRRSPGGWEAAVLDETTVGQARIDTDGERLLVARDDGGLGLWDTTSRTDIHTEGAKLRGAVLANLDPTSPGLEAATGGYEGDITVLRQDGPAWRAERVYVGDARLHHLAAGPLWSLGDGVVVVACGYGGRVLVVRRAAAEG